MFFFLFEFICFNFFMYFIDDEKIVFSLLWLYYGFEYITSCDIFETIILNLNNKKTIVSMYKLKRLDPITILIFYEKFKA